MWIVLLPGCAQRRTFRADGKPWPIPGRIEAENFDDGTLFDSAYHDTTWLNEAPQDQRYRDSSVDIGVDAKLGLVDVGWIEPTEWLEYTVDVQRTGRYRLIARVATPENGRNFRVAFAGTDRTGPIPVPNTGCWGSDLKGGHCFGEAVAHPIRLEKGTVRMRLLAGTGHYTIDWIRFDWEGE